MTSPVSFSTGKITNFLLFMTGELAHATSKKTMTLDIFSYMSESES